jgi:nucleotide-binding universal stress UspA family protein
VTTVLLAVDETDESVDAVKQARRLFGPDAIYLAVNVAEGAPGWAPLPMSWGAVYPFPYAATYPLVEEEVDAPNLAAEEAQETAQEVAGSAGVDAAAIGDVGDPTAAILAAARSHTADVIVVGPSDKGWWRRLFEGSVTRDIVQESTIPVLVAGRRHED